MTDIPNQSADLMIEPILPGEGVLIIGNESKGIGEELIKKAKHRVTIPKKGEAESLNAGVAAGILMSYMTGGK